MMEEDVGDGEGVFQLAVPDERHGADDADALLPEVFSVLGQIIKQLPVLVQQPHPQQGIAAQVHQVPVVDAVGVGEVEIDAILLRDARSGRA